MIRFQSALTILWLVAVTITVGACAATQVASRGHATSATSATSYQHSGTTAANKAVNPGLLVVAPDRGFLGNEETRDAFVLLEEQHNAELVFATDERMRTGLKKAMSSLVERGALEVVVLPLFLSSHHPKLVMVHGLLGQPAPGSPALEPIAVSVPLRFARPLGDSYLAVEILADRLRDVDASPGSRLVVVGHGAADAASRREMEAGLQRIAEQAAAGFGFESVHALVSPDGSAPDDAESSRTFRDALAGTENGEIRVVVLPFHLGAKLDSMMSFTTSLRRLVPEGARLVEGEVTPHPAVSMWMLREANRAAPLAPEHVGVVFLAHGSDYHWNETMRQAIAPLAERYAIEFAFSMADQPVVERAVRRLEQRGAKAIVIVRVFGLASSFRGTVERMIGADIERPRQTVAGHDHGGGHGHGHGHGHSATASPPPRIRSAAVMTTLGGLEASELFAAALLDRAREHSANPSQETVILVAHGAGEDADNQHWVQNLEVIAEQMRTNGGSPFRAIQFGTWREDWPGKRQVWVKDIRRMVEEAGQDGGRAIVIPARTTGQGPARELLSGLSFELSSGFAPHPLFAKWVEEQVREGIAQLEAMSRTRP